MRKTFFLILVASLFSCSAKKPSPDLVLFYSQPAKNWNEALPVGNSRLGAMIFGAVARETGEPHDYSHPGASQYLDSIRHLLFAGKQQDAEKLAMEHFMSIPLRQMAYQPFGDVFIDFPGHEQYTDYRRSLNISEALSRTSYKIKGLTYTREIFASEPDQVIVIRLTVNMMKKLSFNLRFDSPHEQKQITTNGQEQTLTVGVKDGVLHGTARLRLETDGRVRDSANMLMISDAGTATIYLAAATNFVNFKDVSGDPGKKVNDDLAAIKEGSYKQLRKAHIADYQSLYNRFAIDFGSNGRDSLPMDQRLRRFGQSPEDPGLIALYVQYGDRKSTRLNSSHSQGIRS